MFWMPYEHVMNVYVFVKSSWVRANLSVLKCQIAHFILFLLSSILGNMQELFFMYFIKDPYQQISDNFYGS